ncbi:MAG: SulP family inorganic anion transporter [Oscillospiraceae bacterium]|nr:SulP family inorganic anion transporter [Oscillospiraceae bacterium]
MEQFRVRTRRELVQDLLTGCVIGLLSIPLSMGYAQVAGLPARCGLYGSLFTVLAFGLASGSPRYVFCVDAAPAALAGMLLPTLGIAAGSAEAASFLPVFTLMTACWLFLFWLLRGGNYAKFISEPVLGGCVTGIACIVMLGILPRLFGGEAATGRAPALLGHLFGELGRFHLLSFVLGSATVVLVLALRDRTRMSVSVVIMAAAIPAGMVLDWEGLGVRVVEPFPGGLPRPSGFDFSWLARHTEAIVVDSLAVALVIAAETLVSCRALAREYGEETDGQREMLAYAGANLVAALFGSSPAIGSISRTRLANLRGVRSQWMSVSACLTLALFLLIGTPLLRCLPVPVMTGIVVASLISIMEFGMAGRLWVLERSEFFIFAGAFAAELIGLAEGVLAGLVLSFVSFTMRSSRQPRYFLGVLRGEEGFHDLAQHPGARPIARTVLYQFNGALFFANAEDMEHDILDALREDTALVVVMGISSVDMFAAERLLDLYRLLKRRGIRLYLCGHVGVVREQLISYGAKEMIREGAVRRRLTQALAAGGIVPPYELGTREKAKK